MSHVAPTLIVVLRPSVLSNENKMKELLTRGIALDPPWGPLAVQPVFTGKGSKGRLLGRFLRALVPSFAPDRAVVALKAKPEVADAYVLPPLRLASPEEDVLTAAPTYATAGVAGGHLADLPGGLFVEWAHGQGYSGAGVNIIDVERDWDFAHPALAENLVGVLAGIRGRDYDSIRHGTRTAGVISGDRGSHVVGIAPDSPFAGVSSLTSDPAGRLIDTADAITVAADHCNPGDVIVVEMQAEKPYFGLLPIEWWSVYHAAITYATNNRQAVVVEAAGNQGRSLDEPTLIGVPGRHGELINPLLRDGFDSGAIIVGGGIPPGGPLTYARIRASNYGSCVDCQGWGYSVYTTDFALDLFGDRVSTYTNGFDGTSSATAMIGGLVALVQQARRQAGKEVLSSLAMRRLLREAPGEQYLGAEGQGIGKLPNAKALITLALEWD